MLNESFKTFDRSELLFGFDHLGRRQIANRDVHEFVVSWNHVLDNLGTGKLDPFMLRDVFYRKIKEESDLKYDLNKYERMKEGDPDKTYE